MELDDRAKNASRELGDALNAVLDSNINVRDAIDHLRELGFEPNLTLRLELSRTSPADTVGNSFELELSDEDLRTLQSMKISFE